MEELKTRHPHAFIQIMTQELLRSVEENDLDQAKNIGNEIQALNTMADENHKKLGKDFVSLTNELKDAKVKIDKLEDEKKKYDQKAETSENTVEPHQDSVQVVKELQEKDSKIVDLGTQIEDLKSKLKNSEEKSELMKKDFVMKLQKAKEDMSEAIKIQLATNEKLALTKKNLDGIMEASKLENVRISNLEEENKKLNLENKTLKNQSISFKLLKAKYRKLENESKETETKMEILAKESKRYREALTPEKQSNHDLRAQVKSLEVRNRSLNLKYLSLKEEKSAKPEVTSSMISKDDLKSEFRSFKSNDADQDDDEFPNITSELDDTKNETSFFVDGNITVIENPNAKADF